MWKIPCPCPTLWWNLFSVCVSTKYIVSGKWQTSTAQTIEYLCPKRANTICTIFSVIRARPANSSLEIFICIWVFTAISSMWFICGYSHIHPRYKCIRWPWWPCLVTQYAQLRASKAVCLFVFAMIICVCTWNCNGIVWYFSTPSLRNSI